MNRCVKSLVQKIMLSGNDTGFRTQSWGMRVEINEYSRDSALQRKVSEAWMAARLRRNLNCAHWQVLTAKFSTCAVKKNEAVLSLLPHVVSPAPAPVKIRCMLIWAFPKGKGSPAAKRSIPCLPEDFYQMSDIDVGTVSIRTKQRWLRDIHLQLNLRVEDALYDASSICRAEGYTASLSVGDD